LAQVYLLVMAVQELFQPLQDKMFFMRGAVVRQAQTIWHLVV
jgi:hypothetical protein